MVFSQSKSEYKSKSPVDDWGGWRGFSCRPSSTSFPRECGEPTRSGRPDSLAIANSQLRDSVGITPTSPRSDRYLIDCIVCREGAKSQGQIRLQLFSPGNCIKLQ